MSKALWFIATSCFPNSCFLPLASLSCAPTALELAVIIQKQGGGARKRYQIPILLLVFSISGVIVYSVFSCTVSVPGGDAVVCL